MDRKLSSQTKTEFCKYTCCGLYIHGPTMISGIPRTNTWVPAANRSMRARGEGPGVGLIPKARGSMSISQMTLALLLTLEYNGQRSSNVIIRNQTTTQMQWILEKPEFKFEEVQLICFLILFEKFKLEISWTVEKLQEILIERLGKKLFGQLVLDHQSCFQNCDSLYLVVSNLVKFRQIEILVMNLGLKFMSLELMICDFEVLDSVYPLHKYWVKIFSIHKITSNQ